jgi:SAM-dependent methyltransferase
MTSDHFSSVSAGYAAYRPRYPKALFETLAALAPHRRLAWDCGAGTGQATLDLAEWFDRVIATDSSASQLSQAPQHPRISWRVASAESTDINAGTVDLIAVAQALHWFDQPAFYREARRVAVKGGVIAVWSYGSVQLDGAVGEAVSTFEHLTVGPYWPVARKQVEASYSGIGFPFTEVQVPPIRMAAEWTRDRVLGYLRTWSATSRYVAAHGTDPVTPFAAELAALWPDDHPRTVTWPLTVRVGRIE